MQFLIVLFKARLYTQPREGGGEFQLRLRWIQFNKDVACEHYRN